MNKYYLNTERAHLMCPAISYAMKVETELPFVESKLRKAVKELASRCEMLRVTVYIEKNGRACLRPDSAQEIPITVTNDDWKSIMERENKIPFDFESGSLLRLFVMPKSAGFDLLFYFHHIIGDGKSAILLIKDFLKIYAGISTAEHPLRLINRSDFPKEAKIPLFPKLYLSWLNRAWKKSPEQFSFIDYRELFHSYHTERTTGYHHISLDSSEANLLYQNCRQHNITVNSAVLSACFCASQELDRRYHGKKIKATTAVDIRKELLFDAETLIGNYASGISIEYEMKADFWTSAKEIHSMLQKKLRDPKARWLCLLLYTVLDDRLKDAMFFSACGTLQNEAAFKTAAMMGYGGEPLCTGLTNLGKEDVPFSRAVVFIPPAAPGNDKTVGIVTCNGNMEICFSYEKTCIGAALVSSIADRAKTYLLGKT